MFMWNMCCLKRVHSDQIQGCVTKAGFLQEALKKKNCSRLQAVKVKLTQLLEKGCLMSSCGGQSDKVAMGLVG